MGRLENLKPRGRNRQSRKRNSIIVIGCEGKNKTEEIYFKNFNSRQCIIKFSTGNSTDPVGIVKDLIRFIENDIGREKDDKYYVVIDTDINQNKQSQIDKARELAIENGIEFITSIPTFEYWYILHFEYTTKIYNSSEAVQNAMKEKIKGYTKSMNIYNLLKEKTDVAIKNAKEVEKYHLKEGKSLDNENSNPYTGVYKVVEELIRRNK
ncbi:MAG: RloB family protein [Clostridia bacterium]